MARSKHFGLASKGQAASKGQVASKGQAASKGGIKAGSVASKGGMKGGGVKMIAKRHRHVIKDILLQFTKPMLRRLCRRAGIKRINQYTYAELRSIMYRWLENVLESALIYCDCRRSSTLMPADVVHAMALMGQRFYVAAPKEEHRRVFGSGI